MRNIAAVAREALELQRTQSMRPDRMKSTAALFRSAVLTAALAGVLFLATGVSDGTASCKKGIAISINTPNQGDRIDALQASWYYNWGVTPAEGVDRAVFVPMIWGIGKTFDKRLDVLAADGPDPFVLGYNEPDHDDQADLSVAEAVEGWDELSEVARTLSSPAPVHALGEWMGDFMREAEAENLKVDFVAVHWYGAPDAKRFLRWLDKVHAAYAKPIWITEFSVADWKAKEPEDNRYTRDQVIGFLKAVLPELDRRSYVHRYAWFGAGARRSPAIAPSLLFTPEGTLSDVGQVYAGHSNRRVSCKLH